MSILTRTAQPVNTRYWSGSSVVQFADETCATCDRGLLTIRQGQPPALMTTTPGGYWVA